MFTNPSLFTKATQASDARADAVLLAMQRHRHTVHGQTGRVWGCPGIGLGGGRPAIGWLLLTTAAAGVIRILTRR